MVNESLIGENNYRWMEAFVYDTDSGTRNEQNLFTYVVKVQQGSVERSIVFAYYYKIYICFCSNYMYYR